MDLMDEWVHEANECIHINLTRPSSDPDKAEPIFSEPFNPTFTYAIFENDEKIIGYKDPSIGIDFRANDLRPSLKTEFEKKIDLSGILGDVKATDIETVFNDHLPASAFDSSAATETAGPDPASSDWKPPGKRLHSFELHGKQYEIWTASFADPRALQIWKNMQILVLFYIEGASQLDLTESWSLERWSLHLLYEVTSLDDEAVSPYTLAGFSTSHRYWVFPTFQIARATKSLPSPPPSSNGDAARYTPPRFSQDPETLEITERIDPLDVPSRERISQFLILPPYQGQSLGSRLYDTIFGYYVKMQNIYEIPVEDPSEDFDAMRDYSDIAYLRKLPAFKKLSISSSIPPEKLRKDALIPRDLILGNGTDMDALRHETKIVPRQFNRMVELHLLSTIPPLHRNTARITRKDKSSNENDRKYYFWRLALKDRIYRQNADTLDQMEDATEKVDKLEAAVDGQLEEYLERLEGIEKREKWTTGDDDEGDAQPGASSRSKAKRKRIVVDEDDGWEDMEEKPKTGSKKPRK